ncbi:MAG: replication protein RepA [Terriglobia bacterium]
MATSPIPLDHHPPSAPDLSLARVGEILPRHRITKRKLKEIESICLIREQRASGRQELAFNARPFVLCGIPLRRPPRGQLTYSRHSGKFFLQIIGHPEFGLPFGQDRLVPIWVATLALQQKSRIVRFESASQMLDFFKLCPDGYHYRRIVDGFKRIFASTIFFGTEDHPAGRTLIDWARFHFFDQMKLWFNADERNHAVDEDHDGNVITLSEAFYKEIDQHRIPVEREVVSALAHAPGVLDFYLWVVWKSWTINGLPARIPVFGPGGLNEQLGSTEYSLDRRFRHTIVAWLTKVKAFWPECPAVITNDRRFLIVHSSRKSPAIHSATN